MFTELVLLGLLPDGEDARHVRLEVHHAPAPEYRDVCARLPSFPDLADHLSLALPAGPGQVLADLGQRATPALPRLVWLVAGPAPSLHAVHRTEASDSLLRNERQKRRIIISVAIV